MAIIYSNQKIPECTTKGENNNDITVQSRAFGCGQEFKENNFTSIKGQKGKLPARYEIQEDKYISHFPPSENLSGLTKGK